MGSRGVVFKALCLLAFASLARLSSLLPPGSTFDFTRYPTFADLSPMHKGFLFRVKFAKNAQATADAFQVPILRALDRELCPVRALRALSQLYACPKVSDPLFRWPTTQATRLSPSDPCLTAPVARSWLRRSLDVAGIQLPGFSFHSFRRGGCTVAAEEGATVHELQSLGNWRSMAVTRYFPSLPAQLRAATRIAHAGSTSA